MRHVLTCLFSLINEVRYFLTETKPDLADWFDNKDCLYGRHFPLINEFDV